MELAVPEDVLRLGLPSSAIRPHWVRPDEMQDGRASRDFCFPRTSGATVKLWRTVELLAVGKVRLTEKGHEGHVFHLLVRSDV